MSWVSLEEAPRNVLSEEEFTGSETNAGSNNALALFEKWPPLNPKLDQSFVFAPQFTRFHVAAVPEGLTVGQPLASVLFVPAATGVAIAGPPLATGRKQTVAVRWVSPSIWKTPVVVELSTPDWAKTTLGPITRTHRAATASTPRHRMRFGNLVRIGILSP